MSSTSSTSPVFPETGRRGPFTGIAPSATRFRAGCAAGYMPELNVLCGIADISTQSEQPVTKHLVVEVTPAGVKAADR